MDQLAECSQILQEKSCKNPNSVFNSLSDPLSSYLPNRPKIRVKSTKTTSSISRSTNLSIVSTSSTLIILLLLANLLSFSYCYEESKTREGSNRANYGEGRPPLLSHIRVSRGPLDDILMQHSVATGAAGPGRASMIKSPSYKHRMLHMTQFNGGNGEVPIKNLASSSSSGSASSVSSPLANVYMMKGHGHPAQRNSEVSITNGVVDEEDDARRQEYYEDQDFPFSPYIGARALSNMPMFFEHLKDNLESLQKQEELEDPQSFSSGDVEVSVEDLDGNNERVAEDYPRIFDGPQRRGDYFLQSDGRLSINPNDFHYQYDKSDEVPAAAVADSRSKGRSTNSKKYDLAKDSLDMLTFMGRDPKYKKANQYRPSWLFTNLGLGKRSRL